MKLIWDERESIVVCGYEYKEASEWTGGEGKVRIRNAKPGWVEEEVILSDRAGEIIPCLLNLYRGEYC